MASTGNNSSPFEGLDITNDEAQRIEKALKNEEFRKLFVEYAQEISDPENRRKYEAELAELERSRGMDVKFLHPKPGYVLKTSVNGEKKAFINICMNEFVGIPESEKGRRGSGPDEQVGVQWTLPHSLAPGRDDLDHAGSKCVVYDCLFHPECFDHIERDKRFRTLMESTAMDGIEREFHVTLDRNNIKRPKMKFKGRAQATLLRTPRKEGPSGENSLDSVNIQYPYDKLQKDDHVSNEGAKSSSKISGNRSETKASSSSDKIPGEKKNGVTKPRFSLIHRGHFDMQQYTNARDSMPSTRPQELIVKVELPLLKSAATVQLDIFERRLHLECKKPVSYGLDLPLPFPVDEEKGSAKFDKSKSCLTINLVVLPPEIPTVPSITELSNAKPLVEEISVNSVPPYEGPLRTNGSSDKDIKEEEHECAVLSDGTENKGAKADVHIPCHSMEDEGEQASKEPPYEEAKRGGETSPAEEIDQHLAEPDAENTKTKREAGEPTSCLSNHTVGSEDSTSVPNGNDASCISILPRYDFYQNEESITLIIREAGIDPNTLAADVTDGGQMMQVTCRGQDSPAQEMYSIIILCMEGQTLEEDVTKDVSDKNSVLMVKKKEGCGNLWTGFKAGLSKDTLEKKLFLTEASLEDLLNGVIEEQPPCKETEPCSVTHFSAECVRAQFEVTTKEETEAKECCSHMQEEEGSSQETGSMLPALNLEKLGDHDDESSHCSDSQSSPPSSSSSRPPGLKSALRSPRRRAYKSVSFSEEVLVELFLEGPNPGRQQKGGNKKKKGARRAPFFGPRRTIEKLKDNSWESYSDSELLHGSSSGHMEEDNDHEGSEWDWRPNQVLMRQSSSESESGPEVPSSPRTKGKKSKGSRRRRKEKARREASVGANQDPESPDTNESSADPALSEETESDSKPQAVTADAGIDNNNVTPKLENCKAVADVTNNNEKNKEEEELPLEMQDHATKCAFEFSNQVIFDLDD